MAKRIRFCGSDIRPNPMSRMVNFDALVSGYARGQLSSWPSGTTYLAERADEVRTVFEVIDAECQALMSNPDAMDMIAGRYELERDEAKKWLAHVRWHIGFDEPTEDSSVSSVISNRSASWIRKAPNPRTCGRASISSSQCSKASPFAFFRAASSAQWVVWNRKARAVFPCCGRTSSELAKGLAQLRQ